MRPSASQAAHIFVECVRYIWFGRACRQGLTLSAGYMRFIMHAVLVITFDCGGKIKKNERGGNLARQGEVKNACRIFVGKPCSRSFLV